MLEDFGLSVIGNRLSFKASAATNRRRLLIQTDPRQHIRAPALRMLLICWRSWFTVLSVLVVVSLNNGPVTSRHGMIEWPRVLGVSPMRPNIKPPLTDEAATS